MEGNFQLSSLKDLLNVCGACGADLPLLLSFLTS